MTRNDTIVSNCIIVTYSNFIEFRHVVVLVKFGQIWSNLVKFGQVCTSLDKFEQVWTSVDKFEILLYIASCCAIGQTTSTKLLGVLGALLALK